MNNITEIVFQPLIAWPWLIFFSALFFAPLIYISVLNRRVTYCRLLFTAWVIVLLINPVLKQTTGTPTETVLNLLIDSSYSQYLGKRDDNIDLIAETVLAGLSGLENVRIMTTRLEKENNQAETHAMTVLRESLTAESPERSGGSILITDGRIHDLPENFDALKRYGPIHVIMSGERNREFDRHIRILSAPGYALVGEDLPVRLRIDESPRAKTETLALDVYSGGERLAGLDVPVGEDYTVQIPVRQPGTVAVRFEIATHEDELSAVNNTAIVTAQGVRDKLKVLLVSGQPHQGLRIWRNLLKSDPAVELVHFTILRSYDSIDITPANELALIPFPTEELFAERIGDFDLIIMDRFTHRSILLPEYFNNIVNFVRTGGGLLVVHGPEESTEIALVETYLGDILPYHRILDAVVATPGAPVISAFGQRHPIMQPMKNMEQTWGDWARRISGIKQSDTADVLLETPDGAPLLAIDRVGDGRVAQFMTDQIWLWARGYDGGGPYGDLMKRLAHWLMKEPTLDYTPLTVTETAEGFRIDYAGKDLGEAHISITWPDRKTVDVAVTPATEEAGNITFSHHETADMPGLYDITYADEAQHFMLGDLNKPEVQDLVSAPAQIRIAAEKTGGALIEYKDLEGLSFQLTDARQNYYNGRNLYFARSTALEDRNTHLLPLIHWALAAGIGLLLLLGGWLRQE